ncbi:MAG: adenylate kinase, partial [Actinobacteria bacterium]|nr:adenylate kinase [Actinomycetota bacterium]
IAYYREEGLLITIPAVGEVPTITGSAIRALAAKLS